MKRVASWSGDGGRLRSLPDGSRTMNPSKWKFCCGLLTTSVDENCPRCEGDNPSEWINPSILVGLAGFRATGKAVYLATLHDQLSHSAQQWRVDVNDDTFERFNATYRDIRRGLQPPATFVGSRTYYLMRYGIRNRSSTPANQLSNSEGSMRHPPSNLATDLVLRPLRMLTSDDRVDHVTGESPQAVCDRKTFGGRFLP
jgi:hypothetical protein